MDWSADDERRVARALVMARDALTSIGRDLIGVDIIFTTLRWAVDVERRQRIRGAAPRPLKAAGMDYLRTKDEHEADFRQRMVDIAAGDDPEEVFGIFVQPSPQEVDTMESINTVFRSCVVGRSDATKARDWRIVQLAAKGKMTAQSIAKQLHCTRALVADRRKLQCGAIWARLRHLMPPLPAATGTVWKTAA